jgi:hypothetical protein
VQHHVESQAADGRKWETNLEPEQACPSFDSLLVRSLQVRFGQNVVSSIELASML